MREFSVSAGNITVAGATTLIFINPAAAVNPNLEFLRFWIGQTASTSSAQQRIQIETQIAAFPTLTSAVVAKKKETDVNASVIAGNTTGAAGTAGINASAENAGTKTAVHDDAFNVLNGYLHVPTPPETIVKAASSTSGLGLFFPAAPTNTGGWAFGLIFREI